MLTGQMMSEPLLILDLLRHATRCHPEAGITSRCHDSSIHRYSYAEAWSRVNRLAGSLRELSVAPGDRLGTIAWNDYRHFELYYAVSGSGAVIHTINPRLSDEQIVYIINHAGDRFLIVDPDFLPLLARNSHQLETVEGVIQL